MCYRVCISVTLKGQVTQNLNSVFIYSRDISDPYWFLFSFNSLMFEIRAVISNLHFMVILTKKITVTIISRYLFKCFGKQIIAMLSVKLIFNLVYLVFFCFGNQSHLKFKYFVTTVTLNV